jgi:hypothetical protein
MLKIFLTLFLYQLYFLGIADSTFTKKYCLAYNSFYSPKLVDNNVYAYTNFYNNKRDYFVYLNYFNRTKTDSEIGKTNYQSVSLGFFYDHTLTKRSFIWSFYQGEKSLKDSYNVHQFSGGIGLYLLNKDKAYITFNNGVLYKVENGISQYRYNLRLKSRITLRNRAYVETYNYFQPSLIDWTNINVITFNTLTIRIRKQFNFKFYHWLSKTNKVDNLFQYGIIGFSIENW